MKNKTDYKLIQLILIGVVTLLSLGYVMIWWGIVEPIMTISEAIDNKTVTASLVGWELIKFLLKETLGAVIVYMGFTAFIYRISN